MKSKTGKSSCGNAHFAMLLLAVFLSCQQANILISRVRAHDLQPQDQAALIQEIKLVSPKTCDWKK